MKKKIHFIDRMTRNMFFETAEYLVGSNRGGEGLNPAVYEKVVPVLIFP